MTLNNELEEVSADAGVVSPEASSVDPLKDRLFDFFKHMTTLSLLTLGGVLSIGSQTGVQIDPLPMAIVVAFLAMGGIGAYSGMIEIIEAESRREHRPKRIALYKTLSSLGFGMGTGAFLSTFLLSFVQ